MKYDKDLLMLVIEFLEEQLDYTRETYPECPEDFEELAWKETAYETAVEYLKSIDCGLEV